MKSPICVDPQNYLIPKSLYDEGFVSHIYQPLRLGSIWHKVNF